MPQQTWWYRIRVVLLVILLSIPQVMSCVSIGENYWRGLPLPIIPGISHQNIVYSRYSYANLWKGKFIEVVPDSELIMAKKRFGVVKDWKLVLVEPETGTIIQKPFELSGSAFRPVAFGDRLFLIGMDRSFEFIDDELKPIELPWASYRPMVQIDGKVAQIKEPPDAKEIVIAIPDGSKEGRELRVVLPLDMKYSTQTGLLPRSHDEFGMLVCINQGDIIHAFLRSNDRLFYRNGLPLYLEPDDGTWTAYGTSGGFDSTKDDVNAGWTIVRDVQCDAAIGTLIEGKPGALLVDNIESGSPVGQLYKFDGTVWNRIAELKFPFGSNRFRALARGDDKSPYIVATSATGTGFAYVVEDDGIREIPGQGAGLTWSHTRGELLRILYSYIYVFGLGFIPCLGLWPLMAFSTKPGYSTGNQTVKFASLSRRGIARLIDLTWIIAVAAFVGWNHVRGVDWYVVAESLQMKIDHPAIETLKLTPFVIARVLFPILFLDVLVQARWGTTPGKWICGVRTIRSNLRPCGFARSLVREILLAIDSCYLLWWLPGSLCIALTKDRRRLGDIIGDTIVVEASSLNRYGHDSVNE